MSKQPILEMHHITKSYLNVTANKDVSIKLFPNEILAIVGENGAGKTTLMKILYGLEKPDKGEIIYKGQPVAFRSPSEAIKLGIGMVQQHFMLFGSLTVAENIVYQNEPHNSIFFKKNEAIQIVEDLSKKYSLQVDPNEVVDICPVGLQQRIEILKILYQNAETIIFDEPTAVLTPLEVENLLATMRWLSKMGKSIILITHKLSEVMAISDRVVVMRDGAVVAESDTNKTDIDTLSFHVVNRQIEHVPISAPNIGSPLLEVKDLTLLSTDGKKVLNEISLHVNSGEIVGIAGVSGNGQSELVECITGLVKFDSGKINIGGKPATNGSVLKNRALGIAHIPEDRYSMGCAKEASVSDNILMGSESQLTFSKWGFQFLKEIRKFAQSLIFSYNIKADSELQKVSELSGGNTQKMIAAREISKDTPVLIANEPTRGIDIGATEFIHEKLIEKRDQGGCVLLVSSELSEIIKLSDRIYVIFNGIFNGEVSRGKLDEKGLGILMLGGRITENV